MKSWLPFTFLFLTASFHAISQNQYARGKKIVYSTCVHCHGAEDGSLGGNRILDAPKILGKIIAPSLTSNGVVGQWTEQEFKRFLRTGSRPDLSKKRAYMPLFPNMSDADINSVFIYLKSTTTPEGTLNQKRSRLSWVAKLASNLFLKNYGEQITVMHPDTTNRAMSGKYLVNDVLHCFACHSSNPAKTNYLIPDISKGYLQGGFRFKDLEGKKVTAPKIAFLDNTSNPYTEDEFLKVLLIGKKRNGAPIRHPMKPYTLLSVGEMKAIYAYLSLIPSKK